MSERTSVTADLQAPAQAILRIIQDVESYPSWAHGIAAATVESRDRSGRVERARLVMDSGPVKDTITVTYTHSTAGQDEVMAWSLVHSSLLRRLEGAYTVTPQTPESCCVRYDLVVETTMPLIPALRRKAEKQIVDAALISLAERAEGRTAHGS